LLKDFNNPSHRSPAPLCFPPHMIALGSLYAAAILLLESANPHDTAEGVVLQLGQTGQWETTYAAAWTQVDGMIPGDHSDIRRDARATRPLQHHPILPRIRSSLHSLPGLAERSRHSPALIDIELEHGVPDTEFLDPTNVDRAEDSLARAAAGVRRSGFMGRAGTGGREYIGRNGSERRDGTVLMGLGTGAGGGMKRSPGKERTHNYSSTSHMHREGLLPRRSTLL